MFRRDRIRLEHLLNVLLRVEVDLDDLRIRLQAIQESLSR